VKIGQMGVLNKGEAYTVLKTAIVVFGIMIVIIECHAFFESPWNKRRFRNLTVEGDTTTQNPNQGNRPGRGPIQLIDFCAKQQEKVDDAKKKISDLPSGTSAKDRRDADGELHTALKAACPTIGPILEYYFLVALILIFLSSCVSLGLSLFAGGNALFKRGDPYFHIVAAILLLIGGIINVISAMQIQDRLTTRVLDPNIGQHLGGRQYTRYASADETDQGQFFIGKVTAGVFAGINSLVYVGTGIIGLM